MCGYVATFLCDGVDGGRSGSADYWSIIRASELFDNDDLSPREAAASGLGAESHRLAAGAATADVAESGRSATTGLSVRRLLMTYTPGYIRRCPGQAAQYYP